MGSRTPELAYQSLDQGDQGSTTNKREPKRKSSLTSLLNVRGRSDSREPILPASQSRESSGSGSRSRSRSMSLSMTRSRSQTPSNTRLQSRTQLKRESRSSSRSRSRVPTNPMSLFARRSSDPFNDQMSFYGIDKANAELAFDDPNLPNLNKQLEKSFSKKFADNVWNNDSTWVKVFLVFSCCAAVLILVLEIAIFSLIRKNVNPGNDDDVFDPSRVIYGYYGLYLTESKALVSSYMTLYIYAEVYQIAMTLIVLYTRNIFHLISCIIFLVAMSIYSGVQLNELKNTVFTYSTYVKIFSETDYSTENRIYDVIVNLAKVVCVLSSITTTTMGFISWKLRPSFRQNDGEAIGLSGKKVNANIAFNVQRDALLLALFFTPGFFLQLVVISGTNEVDFKYSMAALFISIVVICTADLFAAREKKIGTTFSIFCYLGILTSILVLLLFSSFRRNSAFGKTVNQSIMAFGIITIVLLVLLMAVSILVIRNFGVGLYQIYAKNYDWLYKSKHVPVEKSDVGITEFSYQKQTGDESYEMFDFGPSGGKVDQGTSALQLLRPPEKTATFGASPFREELDF
ncbi:hypothetical protein CANARDRAFT_25751 [[Candida] arabinofermentans NRRL YB-2248]|uniref:TRP C-terminal domain-containing protein n=1 Tax=[Candida] arabinofermentans NRRL YB-2248 TaxID=983967 RepID=A0A1E4SSY4_9ASCO|nr:hypothetical protein CANARDRAFT_25751 [[Candida] arabinofermentans NRRL YB-2248]